MSSLTVFRVSGGLDIDTLDERMINDYFNKRVSSLTVFRVSGGLDIDNLDESRVGHPVFIKEWNDLCFLFHSL